MSVLILWLSCIGNQAVPRGRHFASAVSDAKYYFYFSCDSAFLENRKGNYLLNRSAAQVLSYYQNRRLSTWSQFNSEDNVAKQVERGVRIRPRVNCS